MKNHSDKELADFLLEMRQHGGRTWWRHLKANGWRWLFFVVFILILLGLGTFAKSWGFCVFVICMVAGILSRDGVWLRQQQAVWPFYSKVIDWGEVERIAKGEPAV